MPCCSLPPGGIQIDHSVHLQSLLITYFIDSKRSATPQPTPNRATPAIPMDSMVPIAQTAACTHAHHRATGQGRAPAPRHQDFLWGQRTPASTHRNSPDPSHSNSKATKLAPIHTLGSFRQHARLHFCHVPFHRAFVE